MLPVFGHHTFSQLKLCPGKWKPALAVGASKISDCTIRFCVLNSDLFLNIPGFHKWRNQISSVEVCISDISGNIIR